MSSLSLAEQLAAVTGRLTTPDSGEQSSSSPTLSIVSTRRDGPAILNSTVEKIIVQLSFVHDFLIPAWLYEVRKETQEERDKRKSIPHKGEKFWPNIKRTDMCGLRRCLVAEGFMLVDAFLKERINGTVDTRLPSYYHTARFTFYRTPDEQMTDAWRAILEEKAGPALDEMLENSLWRARGFKNPFFRDGVMIDGMKSISINLEYPERYDARLDESGRSANHVFKVVDHELIID